jgi:hypothetical protein
VRGAPRVLVEPFTTQGRTDAWTVTWRVANESDRPIHLVRAQHPHSQFRTPEVGLDRDIAPGRREEIVLPVHFRELPGVIVENAFLILVLREMAEWRLLARVRVTAGKRGEPTAGESVVVTMQKVGTAP